MLGVYTYKNYLETRNKCIMAVLFDTDIRNLELCTLGMLDIKDDAYFLSYRGKRMTGKLDIYERMALIYSIRLVNKKDNS